MQHPQVGDENDISVSSAEDDDNEFFKPKRKIPSDESNLKSYLSEYSRRPLFQKLFIALL